MAYNPDYKPYRTPRPSMARGPIISPEESTKFSFDSAMILARNEASALRLAQTTGRLLGKLSLPETVLFTLGGDVKRLNPGETPIVDREFFVRAERTAEHEYDVSVAAYAPDGIIDEVDYTVWQPIREGFVMPWGAQIKSAARTVYPRIRSGIVNEKCSLATPTAPVNNAQFVVDALIKGSLADAQQVLPPLPGEEL